MNPGLAILEALGPRVRPHQAPRGTPSRTLKLRLLNSSRRHDRRLATVPPPRASGLDHTLPALDPVRSKPPRHENAVHTADQKMETDELGLLGEIIEQTRGFKLDAAPPIAVAADPATSISPLPAPFRLRQALKNTQSAFDLVKALTSPTPEDAGDLQATIANLPETSFSELLQSLDPVTAISRDLDPPGPVHVGPGMAQFTELGRAIDEFGVRRIYRQLLESLVAAAQLRIDAGRGLLLSDYKVLLRAAGAASDLHMAKKIWHLMESWGQVALRDGEAYTEFVRARFLTEPLYAQFDMARFRVSPANMHKQKIWLGARPLAAVRRLRHNILARQDHRFGQNRYTPEKAEALARILRKTKPVRRVFFKAVSEGVAVDEELLAATMVAFARNGALRAIRLVLARYWKIEVRVDRETRQVTITGGTTVYAPGSPLYPTARLLDALAEAYCCNAEVETALRLVLFVSDRYAVAVPPATWSRLLQWAYVQSSRPASTEWKLARWPDKAVTPAAVDLVWEAMAQAGSQPTFDDHLALIKSLLGRGRLKDALQRMLGDLQPAYAGALAELEDAFYAHASAARLGADASRSRSRWLRARARKQAMWYAVQSCCWQLLKRVRSNRVDDVMTARLVPQLVDAFRPFFARSLRYRTATGLVEIHNPHPPTRLVIATRLVDLPALVTQDLTAATVEASPSPDPGSLVPDQLSDRSRLVRRKRVRLGHGVAPGVLDEMLRHKKLSPEQLQQEFA